MDVQIAPHIFTMDALRAPVHVRVVAEVDVLQPARAAAKELAQLHVE